MADPKSGVAYVLPPLALFALGTQELLLSPTLAAGDVKLFLDDVSLGNITTLPTVSPAASGQVKVSLSAGEMTGARLGIRFVDQTSPKEWADVEIALSIDTATVEDLSGRIPTALVSGRIDASVGAMAANVLTATAINADAITAAKLADGAIDAATFAAGAINAAAIAADAITDAKVASDVTIASVTGAVGSVTGNVGGNVGGNVVGSVASVTAGVTLAAAAVQAIWDALTSALTTVGSIGKLLVDNINAAISSRATPAQVNTEADLALADVGVTTTVTGRIDAAISSRLATAGYTTPPTANAIADQVWDEALAGHLGAGSTGEELAAAGTAGDPWTTPLPGAYGAGTAGKIVGDNLDAAMSSRLASASITLSGGKVTPIDVDGLTHAKAMEVIMAALLNVAEPIGSTVVFKRRDGLATSITVTYGAADGERTASAIA